MSFVENMELLDFDFSCGLGDNQLNQNMSPVSYLEQGAAIHSNYQTKNVFNMDDGYGYGPGLTQKAYINQNGFIHRDIPKLPRYDDQHNTIRFSSNYLQSNEASRIPVNYSSDNGIFNAYNIQNNYNVNKAVPANTKPVYSGVVKKQKRIRTAFTTEQILKLESEYNRTKYLDRNRRVELSHSLSLTERTLKVWFQNRRMKEKKDRAESMEDNEASSTIETVEDRPSFVYEWQGGNYASETPKFTIEAHMLPMGATTVAACQNYFDDSKISKFNSQAWDPNSSGQQNIQIQINGLTLNSANGGFTKSATFDEDLDLSLELLSELSE